MSKSLFNSSFNEFITGKLTSQKKLSHRFVDETIGTFILIFATLFLCWLYGTHSRNWFSTTSNFLYWIEFSLSFSAIYLLLFLLIFFFGHAGALFNPALVLMSRTTKSINNNEAFTYIMAELIGAIFAGLVIYIIAGSCTPANFGNQWTDPNLLGVTTFNENIWVDKININGADSAGIATLFLGFVIELVFFGLFVFLILFLGWRVKKTKVASLKIRCQLINSFIISFGLFVIVSVQIPLTGASCNAFRSLAPLIFESWSTHSIIGWIQFPWYLMSTIVGAQLAAIIFNRSLNKR